ncbi:hypothetical protein Y032_0014g2351 [Ancylostoma ceylanicum]|uniref:Uncharacterized protein n=1 Tax=Ancylostoma ceylanicum TaxID=53326 RepID=A0A016V9P8_9BILA|nr:hypothetical protein Y032_0014g2351 [Ancylostoma ceylanicum]
MGLRCKIDAIFVFSTSNIPHLRFRRKKNLENFGASYVEWCQKGREPGLGFMNAKPSEARLANQLLRRASLIII